MTTSVSFTAEAVCSVCHGSGAEPGTTPETCPDCGGSGQIAVDQGPFSFSQVCPTCGGRGTLITTPCNRCRGTGVEVRPREVKVKIPVGVDDGQRIRVKGRGGAGRERWAVRRPLRRGARPAAPDLRPQGQARSHGARPAHVSPRRRSARAVKVPTLTDPVTLKVKGGTQGGTTQKVKGRGITPAKGSSGDLLVTFDIDVPAKLNDEQKQALEALAATFPGNPREHLEV